MCGKEELLLKTKLSLSSGVLTLCYFSPLQISFNYQHSCIYVYQDEDRIFDWKMPQLLLDLDNDILNCWLTWYCDTIQIGVVNDTKLQKPFFIFKGPNRRQRIIGFVKFINHNHNVNLAIDSMFHLFCFTSNPACL